LTWKKEVFGPHQSVIGDHQEWCYPSRKAQFRVCVCFISVQVVFRLDDFFSPFLMINWPNLCIKNLFNWVSDWVYAYMPIGSYFFFQNLDPSPPPLTRHFLKVI
jgi:hypothetical protein